MHIILHLRNFHLKTEQFFYQLEQFLPKFFMTMDKPSLARDDCHGITLVMSGPPGFAMSIVELHWACFKSANLKRLLKEIVECLCQMHAVFLTFHFKQMWYGLIRSFYNVISVTFVGENDTTRTPIDKGVKN